MSFLILNYFNKSSFLISTLNDQWTIKSKRSYYKGPLFTYGCINQRVKHWLFLDKYPFKVVKVKDCKMKQGGSKTWQKRH